MSDAYRDASLPLAQRVDDLLGRMTLAEKVGQLNQVPDRPPWSDRIEQLARDGQVGSRLLASSAYAGSDPQNLSSVEALNAVQRVAVEQSRLGIPLIHGRDVIHGFRTITPIPLAQAASWDAALVEAANRDAAREATAAGVHWTFAPMVDIARDGRWGRIAEGYGEDPHLAGVMAAAAVRGFQGPNLADGQSLLACAKHYVGYGAAEGGRDYNATEISDTTLRNVYIPPFASAVAAGCGSVMSGFHTIGGEPTSGSHYLLTELLKGELGFGGFVVSDWGSVWQLMDQGLAADRREAAELGFTAGVDMDMCSEVYLEHLVAAVEAGRVSRERLDDAVRRILHAKFALGLFEHPYTDTGRAAKVILAPEHRARARQLAAESIVLLKNRDGVLPLAADLKHIALVGPLAETTGSLLGCWAPGGRAEDVVSLRQGLQAATDAEIFCNTDQADVMINLARKSDLVVLALGEHSWRSGENQCIQTLALPEGQEPLIEALARQGKPLVVVICAGRPIACPLAERLADAVLFAWHGGVEAGHALADVLTGKTSPAGRLPVSVPSSVGQVPIHYNRLRFGRWQNPKDGRYIDGPTEPLYPFGFGLSYTSFAYDDLRVSPERAGLGQTVEVSVQLTNTGGREGTELVQLYVRDCVAQIVRPERELKAFARVTLGPGQSRRVSFPLGFEQLSYSGRDGQRRLDAGEFLVWVGPDSRATLQGRFEIVQCKGGAALTLRPSL